MLLVIANKVQFNNLTDHNKVSVCADESPLGSRFFVLSLAACH